MIFGCGGYRIMKITDLLKCVSVDVNAAAKSKDEAINHLVDLMDKQVIFTY